MTRAPRFSGPFYVAADAAEVLGSGYNLTAEDMQTEMGNPEGDRSPAAKKLTEYLRWGWDHHRLQDLLQYRNGVLSLNDGKKNRLRRSQRRDARLALRRRGRST